MGEKDEAIRQGRIANAARPFVEQTLNGRFLSAALRVCRAGIPDDERDDLLADMRAYLALANSASIALMEGKAALKVETD